MSDNHKQIKDYKILSSYEPAFLENKVKKLIKEGWELQGGVMYDGLMQEYNQAMVLRIKINKTLT